MRKIKRVLDLHARGLSQRTIAGSCGIAQSTVSEYLAAATAAGVTWPEAGVGDRAQALSAAAHAGVLAQAPRAGMVDDPA